MITKFNQLSAAKKLILITSVILAGAVLTASTNNSLKLGTSNYAIQNAKSEVLSATATPTPILSITPTPTITTTPISTPTQVKISTPTPTLKPSPTPTPTPTATPALSNNNSYTNVDGDQIHSPAYTQDNSVPAGASAVCGDGTYSFSTSRRGTCSHHGGVSQWL